MTYKNERWLDHTGLNLIRIVIGSYFLAIALGLITGVDQAAMFTAIMDPSMANLVGTTVLFIIAVAFMSGLFLRMTSLMLALFVLCSSLIENYLHGHGGPVSFFWRDLALACAVLMSYTTLKRRDLRKATLILRQRTRKNVLGKSDIVPRRVAPSSRPSRRPAESDYGRVLRPLIAPTMPIVPTDLSGTQDVETDTSRPARRQAQQSRLARDKRPQRLDHVSPIDPDDDLINIFADV